jgi:hypothetical protein
MTLGDKLASLDRLLTVAAYKVEGGNLHAAANAIESARREVRALMSDRDTAILNVLARAICEGMGDDWHREGVRLTGYDEPAAYVLRALRVAGYAPVPRKPTLAMYQAASDALVPAMDAQACWNAMLNAVEIADDR